MLGALSRAMASTVQDPGDSSGNAAALREVLPADLKARITI